MISKKASFCFPQPGLCLYFTIEFLQQGVHLITNSWPSQIHVSTYHTMAFSLRHLNNLLFISFSGHVFVFQFLDFSLKLTLWNMLSSSFTKFSYFILFRFWLFHLNQFYWFIFCYISLNVGVCTSENLACHSVYSLWANLATPIFSTATFVLITSKEVSVAPTNVEKRLTP